MKVRVRSAFPSRPGSRSSFKMRMPVLSKMLRAGLCAPDSGVIPIQAMDRLKTGRTLAQAGVTGRTQFEQQAVCQFETAVEAPEAQPR